MKLQRLAPSALVVVAALSVGAICGGSSDDEPQLPESAPFPAELGERLHAIRDSVSDLRGLPVNPNVTEGTLTREQLREYYDDVEGSLSDEDQRELHASNTAMRLLRMIGPDDDILNAVYDSDSEGILGFYVAEENELVFIGDPAGMTPTDEFVLAHEYVHSFQDNAFDSHVFTDLVETEEEDFDARTEYGVTTQCLEEGDASIAGFLWAEEALGDAFFDDADEPGEDEPAPEIPPAIERYQAFNYNQCISFAAALYFMDDGWDGIDDAYANPPSTTEHILHPDKYLDGEEPTDMERVDFTDRLGDGWELWWGGIFGEFDVYNYLVTILEDEFDASTAAEGWGIGWLNIYTDGDGGDADVIIHIALEFDTDDDLWEFLAAFGRVLEIVSPIGIVSDNPTDTVCWDASGEFGYISSSEAKSRFDVVIATNPDARERATSGPLSMGTTNLCPAS